MKRKFKGYSQRLDIRNGEFDFGLIFGRIHGTFSLVLSLIFIRFVVFYE